MEHDPMYRIIDMEDTVRIPPDLLTDKSDELNKIIEKLTHENFEGKMTFDNSLIVLVTQISLNGSGKIVHGDGGVYQHVKFNALTFKPELHEIIQGTVCEILKFGAFIRFGPLDGLLHISQIMDDRIDVDLINERLVGKESKRDLKVGDRVRARIVAVSINERNPRESKIGLTMRQPGLGKLDWLEEDRLIRAGVIQPTIKSKGKKGQKSKRKGKRKK
jgi:DNA-directed RNA polymerase subunit E'